ncbi:hypothetical protein K788_0001540 (plasmid) [Paraburkholderia caribensis MBA4]|uniref:Uncharacterized protein n=1 Tax=Paraburkholderia caribensis MBA4 TaxID=1323664 RepID=A0A0P0RMM7_9BURK|nr:hypothetical protein K788_0001540 [Paraburkholderia caribensis MBA4]
MTDVENGLPCHDVFPKVEPVSGDDCTRVVLRRRWYRTA